MKHKVRLTVIDKKLFPELQQQYCANPNSGECPCYHVGDTFIFESDGGQGIFWHMGLNTLTRTSMVPDTVAGGPKIPHCAEAWDAISRYIYAGVQGGSIMKGWMNAENTMITCCNDGTRPVIFKIERLDYKLINIGGMKCEGCAEKIKTALEALPGVDNVEVRLNKGCVEGYVQRDHAPEDELLIETIVKLGGYSVTGIE